jgi:hypothetical protein
MFALFLLCNRITTGVGSLVCKGLFHDDCNILILMTCSWSLEVVRNVQIPNPYRIDCDFAEKPDSLEQCGETTFTELRLHTWKTSRSPAPQPRVISSIAVANVLSECLHNFPLQFDCLIHRDWFRVKRLDRLNAHHHDAESSSGSSRCYGIKRVGPTRFERASYPLREGCSVQLSYGPASSSYAPQCQWLDKSCQERFITPIINFADCVYLWWFFCFRTRLRMRYRHDVVENAPSCRQRLTESWEIGSPISLERGLSQQLTARRRSFPSCRRGAAASS